MQVRIRVTLERCVTQRTSIDVVVDEPTAHQQGARACIVAQERIAAGDVRSEHLSWEDCDYTDVSVEDVSVVDGEAVPPVAPI